MCHLSRNVTSGEQLWLRPEASWEKRYPRGSRPVRVILEDLEPFFEQRKKGYSTTINALTERQALPHFGKLPPIEPKANDRVVLRAKPAPRVVFILDRAARFH
ncbi:C4-dicarboxylate transport sensor protein [Anopheles sinensis]|uniref:C4-dicarboxylate transport sensor protein n=1 Tax=Anopheles sinensis TaxID=74873 RepID=A0A084VI24_ANOSI|nr:C4-dicarboxylate transport sensor protein [Anopheles sinensis]